MRCSCLIKLLLLLAIVSVLTCLLDNTRLIH